MLPRNGTDRLQIAFDDHRLVANAGLVLPVTLAHHLGLGELVEGKLIRVMHPVERMWATSC